MQNENSGEEFVLPTGGLVPTTTSTLTLNHYGGLSTSLGDVNSFFNQVANLDGLLGDQGPVMTFMINT